MSDENKDVETNSEAGQDEWSGTPLKDWSGSEEEVSSEVEGDVQEEAPVVEGAAETEAAVEAEAESASAPTEEAAEKPSEAEPAEEAAEKPSEAKPAEEAAEPAAVAPAGPVDAAGQPVDYSRTFRSLSEGDVVKGVVVHIDKEGVLVDVGTKSEGLIRPGEISREQNVSPEDVVQVGDRIDVYVLQSEDQDGSLVLSKKRADFEKAWERVEQALNSEKVLTAMVTDRVKGGLVVDLGIRGFVPASHVGSGNIKNLDRYVGQSLPLRVIEVDRDRRKVVLSHRLAVEDERQKQRDHTIATLSEGQVRAGIVRRITDYGAFVDLGGIDGLLHISEMSWTRIKHPSEAVRVGQRIQVMILKLDLGHGKVSLGLRQILPDPWSEIERKYHVGDVIKGAVSRLVPFGAFVQVDGGVEGIIPNSELATRRVSKPEDVVAAGQEVEVKIVDLRPDERRMTLSIRQLQQQLDREKDRSELASYTYGTREDARTTIGDLVGDVMREAGRSERRGRKRRERVVEALEEAEAIEEYQTTAEEEPAAAAEAGAPEAAAPEQVEAVSEPEPAIGEAAEVVETHAEAAVEELAEVAEPEPEAAIEELAEVAEPEPEAAVEEPGEVAEPVEAVAEPEVVEIVEIAETVETVESAETPEPAKATEEPAAEAEAEPEAPAEKPKKKR